MVNAETFFKKDSEGRITWVAPSKVKIDKDEKGRLIQAFHMETGDPLEFGGVVKMSKSKENGVDPQEVINSHGADTIRLFSMFAAPPEQSLEWTDSGVIGAANFLKKLWRAVHHHLAAGTPGNLDASSLNQTQRDLRRKTHETIKKVSDDFGRRQVFNTAIAAIMELLNELGRHADRATPQGLAVEREGLEAAIIMLAPIVPHITHVLWEALGHSNLLDTAWPAVDESALVRSSVTIVAQVNGKLRAQFEAPVDASAEELERLALAEAGVQKYLEAVIIRKVITVPNKLVNIVVGP
jgi:leucyl-tRNA synthetase